ncbi:MAG: tyrosine--tRNA ligase [Planctomycetota bacterium]|nr:tyrosine--tRNA ligase [Planctomycetota bacterium]
MDTQGPEVDRQLAVFQRGVCDLIEEQQLRGMIAKSLAEGRPLRIKFGMDPSSPDLHLGHAVQLRKLRDLQDLGHQIVLIVGDATAMVGDPSGRNKLRPVLTREEVDANQKTYVEQAAHVLDMERTEVRQNSEWFDKMDFEELLRLTTRMTVAQMLERDTFQTRMEASEPIGINEFLYPLMQGWDSVQVESDLELGGTDQLFNLLVGRRLQEQMSQRPQIVLTQPLINGLDGRKMSKSNDNSIGLTASAKDMTFRIMQVDDEVMGDWFLHLTRLDTARIEAALAGHPREAKALLAAEVTTFYHDAEAAREAAGQFDREVRDKVLPDDLPEVAWGGGWGEELPLPNLLKELGLCQSTSEARRAIQQGGVRLDGAVKSDAREAISRPASIQLVQVGKKRAARLLPE